MTEEPEVRHMFHGPRSYRVFLLIVTLAMALLLAVADPILGMGTNWARRLCTLIGALSAALFACLVAVDMRRPEALTPTRKAMAVKVFMTFPAIAITLAVVGFFV